MKMGALKTIEEVKDIIIKEGVGYAVEEYLNPDSISDPGLSELWKNAQESLTKIRDYIMDELGDACFDE